MKRFYFTKSDLTVNTWFETKNDLICILVSGIYNIYYFSVKTKRCHNVQTNSLLPTIKSKVKSLEIEYE